MGGGAVNEELIERLKDAGNRLLLPPSETPQLLILLDEVVLLLSKVGQAPSQIVQEALLSTMMALISDNLMKHSDDDVIITVASCLNEILRISAPVAPYEDDKMIEIFELIVLSFDKLSCPPGRCYSKAILILESVARLRSCVMMLDLDCDSLVTKMFQLFQKRISSKHPHSVFLAMEKIMNVMIKESDSLSMELLKVLLESIKKQNQDTSPESFKLGTKVVEDCSEKLKPYIIEAVTSMGCCLEDYAPILSSIYETEPNDGKDIDHDCARHLPSKAIERCSQNPGKLKTEHAADLGNKRVDQAATFGGSSDKKGKPQKKDVTGGSRKKSTTSLSRKDKNQTTNAIKSQRKRASSDDDVIETPHGRKNYKEDLVGCRIKVWWPLDRRYYEGTISSFDEFTTKHKVEYDDGDEEVLNLRTEKWEFLGDEISNDIDLFVDKKSPQPCPNKPKREVSSVCKKETPQTNTKKREVMPDCEVEIGDGGNEAAKIVEKVKTPKDLGEMKRPKLSDGHKS